MVLQQQSSQALGQVAPTPTHLARICSVVLLALATAASCSSSAVTRPLSAAHSCARSALSACARDSASLAAWAGAGGRQGGGRQAWWIEMPQQQDERAWEASYWPCCEHSALASTQHILQMAAAAGRQHRTGSTTPTTTRPTAAPRAPHLQLALHLGVVLLQLRIVLLRLLLHLAQRLVLRGELVRLLARARAVGRRRTRGLLRLLQACAHARQLLAHPRHLGAPLLQLSLLCGSSCLQRAQLLLRRLQRLLRRRAVLLGGDAGLRRRLLAARLLSGCSGSKAGSCAQPAAARGSAAAAAAGKHTQAPASAPITNLRAPRLLAGQAGRQLLALCRRALVLAVQVPARGAQALHVLRQRLHLWWRCSGAGREDE